MSQQSRDGGAAFLQWFGKYFEIVAPAETATTEGD